MGTKTWIVTCKHNVQDKNEKMKKMKKKKKRKLKTKKQKMGPYKFQYINQMVPPHENTSYFPWLHNQYKIVDFAENAHKAPTTASTTMHTNGTPSFAKLPLLSYGGFTKVGLLCDHMAASALVGAVFALPAKSLINIEDRGTGTTLTSVSLILMEG